jgi:PilZ domain
MATGFASVLSEGQLAQLDLGHEVVRCAVVGFTGADVVLEVGTLSEEAPPPGSVAFLLLEAGGRLHALKTVLRPGSTESELIVTLVDSFRLGQRRLFSRAPVVLPAHLRPVGDTAEPWTTFTRDISAGGLRVARQSTYRPAEEHELVIGLVKVGREIRACANVVRESDRDLSLSFTEIRPEDRLLLAQLTFAYHRRSAVS